MKRALRSGHRTGDLCHCGAPIIAYHESRMPPGVTLDNLFWLWVFYCERGHIQAQPDTMVVQLDLFEEAS